MHRAGPVLQRRPVGAARERPDPAQPRRAGGVGLDLEEPLGGAAEQLELIDRLPCAVLAQLGRAVGGQQQQRHPRLVRLDRGRQQLCPRRSPRCTSRRPACPRPSPARARRIPRSARRRASSSASAARAPGSARAARSASPARYRRRASRSAPARPRTRAAAHTYLRRRSCVRPDTRAGMRRAGHYDRRGRRSRSAAWVRRYAPRLGRRDRAPGRRTVSSRWRSTCPGTARRPAMPARSRSMRASSTCWARRPGASCCAATRWAGGSRCTWRWPPRSGCARFVLVACSPGIENADERAARREADERLAEQLEAGRSRLSSSAGARSRCSRTIRRRLGSWRGPISGATTPARSRR